MYAGHTGVPQQIAWAYSGLVTCVTASGCVSWKLARRLAVARSQNSRVPSSAPPTSRDALALIADNPAFPPCVNLQGTSPLPQQLPCLALSKLTSVLSHHHYITLHPCQPCSAEYTPGMLCEEGQRSPVCKRLPVHSHLCETQADELWHASALLDSKSKMGLWCLTSAPPALCAHPMHVHCHPHWQYTAGRP